MAIVSGNGVVAALRSGLLVSDDTRYKQQIGAQTEKVEQAVAGVNTANREFAVGLLAKCIQRETDSPDKDLPAIARQLNAAADQLVLTRRSLTNETLKGDVVKKVVDALQSHFGSFYSAGLKEFIKAGNEERFVSVFSLTLDLLKRDGLENPFPHDDDLKAAVIEHIKKNS